MTKLYKWLTIYASFLFRCFQAFFTKKFTFFLLAINLLSGLRSTAQVSGDFRSTGSTAWNVTTTWERFNGAAWEASGVGANNPGQIPTAADNVFIQTGHAVTLATNAACKDLNLSNGAGSAKAATDQGKIGLVTNTLIINGKLRTYNASLNTIPGTDNANFNVYPFTASAGGKLSIEGNSRDLIATGQWGLTVTNTDIGTFPLEINLNANQTVTLYEGIKLTSLVINTGIMNAGANRIAPDMNVNGLGDVTINMNGTFKSSMSGSTTPVISRTGTGTSGTFTLNGKMILTGASPQINFNTVTINPGSTVELGGTTQSFLTRSGMHIPTYSNLILSGSNNKTPTGNFSTLNDLTVSGTAILVAGTLSIGVGGNWTNYGTGGFTESTSTVDFNGSGAQVVNTTGGEDFFKVKKSGTGTLTLSSDIRLANTSSELNISNGILDAGTFTLSGTTSTALTMTGGSLKLGKLNTTLPEFDVPSYGLSGGTIELDGAGTQILRGARNYGSLTFANSGAKTISSGIPNVNGTVYITGASTVLDISNNTLGGTTTKLSMDGGRFRMQGASLKPDMEDVYTLTGGVIEFYNSATASNQTINGEYGPAMSGTPIQYNQIEVTGNKVGNSNTNITLRNGGSFTVKSTGVFEINDESITQSAGGTQTVTVENGGVFKTGDKDGFSGGTGTLATSVNSSIPTIVLATGSTVEYSRNDIQNITNTLPYSNLNIFGTTGVKTAPTGVLTVQDNLVKSGASNFDANGGTVLLNGTNQSFAGLTYNNLRLDNAGTKTLSASATILDSLTIGNTSTNPVTTLAIGNSIFVTLKSTASKTARLGTVAPAGSISYAGTGRFVVERHYPPRRAWRLLTAPISNDGNRNVFNSWQMGGAATSQSGLFVTGTMAPSGGLDVSPMNNYSFKTFDGLNMIGVDNTISTPISGSTGSAGIPDNYGMFVFVRGDRSSNSLFYPPNSNQTTLRDTGKVQIKTQTFNFSGAVGGYTLIGNPFASEVNMNLVMASGTGIDNTIYYAYDPYLNLEQGGYLTYTADFSGAFTSTPPSPGGQKNHLYSSQAFFVKRTASSGSLTFTESNKSGGIALGAFRPQAGPQSFSVNLYLRKENDSTVLADGVKTLFDESFSNPENILKAKKFININENLGLARDSEILAVEGRAPVTESDTMFLNFTHTALKNYQLRFEAGNPDPLMTAILEDNYTGTKTPINLQLPDVYNFTVLDIGSSAPDRFRIVFKANGTGPLPVIFSQVKAWQQTSKIAVEWTVENELNIDHYEVEKSTHTAGFTKANTTVATGNGQPTNVYRWLDPAIAEGNNFYRILYIEKNGKKGYSRTVNVRTGKTVAGINIYPNPVKGGIIGLQFNNLPAGRYQARLINTVGQILFSKIITVGNGTSTQTIEAGITLGKGICQLEITHPDKTITVLKVVN